MKEEGLVIKAREYPRDYYDQLEGESPFVVAVNKKIADYWVKTGQEMPIMTAAISVLAEEYNINHERHTK